MTREEAIQVLQTALTAPFIYGEYADAIDMAIEAMQAKGDTISRQDAIKAVGKWMQKEFGYLDLNRSERLIDAIESFPSAEPKTGEWKQISPARVYECSECGQNVMTNDIEAYKFCHGCGARMLGEDGEA